ncbi:alpha/beta hydrolase [Maricaulis sp. CAU 1757]
MQIIKSWTLAALAGLALAGPAMAGAPDFAGVWRGALDTGMGELRLELHVSETGDGLSGHLVSVDQGNAEIPAASMSADADRLVAEFPSINARYEARLGAPDRLDGTFTQGRAMGLVLVRGGDAFEAARFEPAPMVGRDIEAVVTGSGITQVGWLRLPEGDGPFPAFVMLTGTGAQDRDETMFGRPVFAAMASALAEHGIATLRLDDRGVGDSTGDYMSATSHDFAADAVAALDWLKAHEAISSAGYLGHSEGAVTAFLAARDSDPDFILSLAGMTSNADQVLYEQAAALIRASGGGELAVIANRQVQDVLIEAARDAEDTEAAVRAATAELNMSPEQAAPNIQLFGRPWFTALLALDMPALIAAYDGPAAFVYAERDLQVLPGPQAEVARSARPDAAISIVPGVNHLFQASETGLPNEYASAPHVIAPVAYEAIGQAAATLVARD